MTVKFSSSSNPRTYLTMTDAVARAFPDSDWTFAVVVGADITSTGAAQYIFSTGGFQSSGSLSFYVTPGSPTTVGAYVDTDGGQSCDMTFTQAANTAYLLVLQRASGVLRTKVCPVLTTAPADGSAVLTSTKTRGISGSLAGPFGYIVFGERNNDRRVNASLGRAFRTNVALTDFEIAKLAFGMEITDLGKTPAWYLRLNDGDNVFDSGPNAYTVTKSQMPMPTGVDPGFGYVSANSPATITGTPTINGTPQVGTTATYTQASVAGTPYPTITQQWMVAGTAVSTDSTYIPTAADAGKALTVKQVATNNQGSASATSSAVTVAAAPDAVTITAPTAERVFQRSAGVAAIDFSGTFSGVQPVAIEYQLYDVAGTTVVKSWADIGATIVAGGTWTAKPTIPQGAAKYRIMVRGKTSAGGVIATSALNPNAFGVGDIIACGGSSSSTSWFNSASGTVDTRICSSYNGGWGNFANASNAATMAAAYAAKAGVVVAMASGGTGGSSLSEWIGGSRWPYWGTFSNVVTAVGGKLAGAFISVGSNDAAGQTGITRSSHAANMRTLISMIRSLVGNNSLPILWSGYNRRTATTVDAASFASNSSAVRMAENDVGNDANVYHVQALDYELSGDGIHLSAAGFAACAARMAYVWNAAIVDGIYKRGPKITSFVASGSMVTGTVVQRGGDTDFLTPLSKTGFAVSDASGTPGITSVTRTDATHFAITTDRALVAPVQTTYLAGSAPPVDGAIYGNGATPLPMNAETEMATTYSQTAPAPDTTAPVMSGSTTVSNVTMNSATVAWTAATDNVGISSYERTLDGGTTWVNVGTGTSTTLNSLTPSTSYSGQVRAIDTSSNRSNALPFSFTTAAAPDLTAPTLTNATATQTGQTTASGAVTTNEAGGTLYRMVSVNASESAATVKAGASSTVTAAGVQSVAFTGLTAGTTYYPHYLHRDGAGNDSAVANGPAFTTASAPTNPVPTTGFTPSAVRTIKAKADSLSFEGGRFWNLTNPLRPIGRKDPDSTIDITMDWTDVLADIGDTIALASFILDGLSNVATRAEGALTTVFVTGGPLVGQVSITFRITTASVPPRVEDRTVYLNMADV